MRKKIIVLLMVIVMAVSFLACVPTGPGGGGGGDKPVAGYGDIPKQLGDLVDYGAVQSGYAPKAITYDASVYDTSDAKSAISVLTEKQRTEQDKHKTGGKMVWTDDDSTFTRIFCYVDCTTVINKMAAAAVVQPKMIKCVDYISRDDVNDSDACNLVVGTGSALEDYNELDALYEAYDNDSKDNDVYDKLQLKKRKVLAEVIDIFDKEADQFARAAAEELAYSEEVVINVMIPEYNQTNTPALTQDEEGFKTYYKKELFDYETLVYLLAFNETVDFSFGTLTYATKPAITTLYGYYYQYEKVDYEVFPRAENGADTEYKDYLKLSHKETMTQAEALRYNGYDRRHYEQAYRYSDAFYTKYYKAHFNFQEKQGIYDIKEYGIGSAVDGSPDLTYSGEMLKGLKIGMTATLNVSDVNYVYTGNEDNVKNYNTKNSAWNGLSSVDQNKNENKIKKVDLERESLKSQLYTMTYNTQKLKITEADLTEALQYQIYSYSGDYLRAIQSYKKSDVTLKIELSRLKAAGKPAKEIAEKEDEIGRNKAMLLNLTVNYTGAGVNTQIKDATNANWAGIQLNIKDAIGTDKQYIDYDKAHQVTSGILVDKYFENILIRRKWSCGGTEEECKKGNSHADCTEDYDTDHALSRLMFQHDKVFRYMYGQVEVEYTDVNLKSGSLKLDDSYITKFQAGNNFTGAMQDNATPGNKYTGSGTLSSAVTERIIFNTKAYKKKTFDTDEVPDLAKWSESDRKWLATETISGEKYNYMFMPGESDTRHYITIKDVKEKNAAGKDVLYTYYYEFIGWYVDTELKYPALTDETYGYDVRLYAGYRITKVA